MLTEVLPCYNLLHISDITAALHARDGRVQAHSLSEVMRKEKQDSVTGVYMTYS